MEQPLIKGIDIVKKFGDQTVLENISFEANKGDILAIIGPNGSGKSTLAKIMIGLEEQTSGEALIAGHNPKRERTRIGYVPQRFNFNKDIPMNVREFLGLSLPGIEENEIHDRLSEVGILHMEGAQVGTLSGGQLQRLMVARALLAEKDILVLDEPSTGIDVAGQKTLYELMQKVNKEQDATVILISHELEVVFRYATSVLCINKEALCHGIPHKVITPDILARLYGGEAEEYHQMKHH